MEHVQRNSKSASSLTDDAPDITTIINKEQQLHYQYKDTAIHYIIDYSTLPSLC